MRTGTVHLCHSSDAVGMSHCMMHDVWRMLLWGGRRGICHIVLIVTKFYSGSSAFQMRYFLRIFQVLGHLMTNFFSVHLCPPVGMLVTMYTPFFIFYFTGALFWVLGLPKFLCIWHLSLSSERIFFLIHKHVSLISPSFRAVFLPLYRFLVSNFLMLHKNTISAVCDLLTSCHLYPCSCTVLTRTCCWFICRVAGWIHFDIVLPRGSFPPCFLTKFFIHLSPLPCMLCVPSIPSALIWSPS